MLGALARVAQGLRVSDFGFRTLTVLGVVVLSGKSAYTVGSSTSPKKCRRPWLKFNPKSQTRNLNP